MRKTNFYRELVISLFLFIMQNGGLYAQKIEFKDIAFHLYTDSLKKGVQNYINVDGLLSDGKWLPLDTTQITYSSNTGRWEQNNLIIANDYAKDSVVINAFLTDHPVMTKSTTIYIKKNPDPVTLPNQDDFIKKYQQKNKRRRS